MAGFFPHIGGVATAGYTPLPIVACTGVLEQMVTDVGAGVNGWTVEDNQLTGSTVTYNVPIYLNGGRTFCNLTYVSLRAFNFLSGSQIATGDPAYGANWFYSISATSSIPSNISVDQTNWYTAYATTWGTYISATLDRNFAQTTKLTKVIYEKLTDYVVFKCTHSQKNFYVWMSYASARNAGCPIKIQTYETWDSTTHSGTNPGPMEHLRFYERSDSALPASAQGQYISWFLPGAFAIWVRGLNQYSIVNKAQMFYVGNLDTSGIRTGDSDALLQAATNQESSGLLSYSSAPDLSTANPIFVGTASVLRALNGNVWLNPVTTDVSNVYGTNYAPFTMHQIFPRGSWYFDNIGRPSINSASKFSFVDLDAYQAGAGATNGGSWSDGRRGMLRYLKVPMSNPTGLHLSTLGPADDGNTYIIILTSYPSYWTNAGPSIQYTSGESGFSGYYIASAFCHGPWGGAYGDFNIPTSVTSSRLIRYFMLPINL